MDSCIPDKADRQGSIIPFREGQHDIGSESQSLLRSVVTGGTKHRVCHDSSQIPFKRSVIEANGIHIQIKTLIAKRIFTEHLDQTNQELMSILQI